MVIVGVRVHERVELLVAEQVLHERCHIDAAEPLVEIRVDKVVLTTGGLRHENTLQRQGWFLVPTP
jgi:hypothetical protein